METKMDTNLFLSLGRDRIENPAPRISNGRCGDRIVDGLCSVELPRLTASHTNHLGDNGSSQLLSGKRVSKGHPAALFFLAVESLQQAIAECVSNHDLYDQEAVDVLLWLHEALFNLSSYAYLKGESTRHQLPVEFLDYLEARSKQLALEVGSAPDFVVFSAPSLLALNKVRIAARAVESAFVRWKETEEVMQHMLDHPEITTSVSRHIQVLNRLSTWTFWLSRRQGLYLQEKGFNVQERYWNASTPMFGWVA